MNPIISADHALTAAISRVQLHRVVEALIWPFATTFNYRGTLTIWVVLSVLLYAVPSLGDWKQGTIFTFISISFAQMINRSLKQHFDRARPTFEGAPRWLPVCKPLPDCPDYASFPSGDTMAGTAIGWSLFYVNAVPLPVAMAIGYLTGFGRVYWHCHYVSDVIVGNLVGTVAPFIVNTSRIQFSWIHFAATAALFVVFTKMTGSRSHKAA